eukprot:gnl/MRDRNA2_/MRDRNA2_111632_c0_seq1.p1 gnl/MRDRNA2_/MRDRNA2_111632_c0~~gnl/MRDRNA2_/MRDRNA2_111632_c0_seq1.p1  ORF type:complete len:416 (-),score=79.33 gnl/MRDRNA2_/MRDRNA2_111632_c0_seq1:209-1456(-)
MCLISLNGSLRFVILTILLAPVLGRHFRRKNAPVSSSWASLSSSAQTAVALIQYSTPNATVTMLSSLSTSVPVNLVKRKTKGKGKGKRKNKGKLKGKQKQLLKAGKVKAGGADDDQPRACPGGGIYPDLSILEKNMRKQKAVFAAHPAAPQTAGGQRTPHYVFISGLPYSGTTALYGLVSTSPVASNLCKGNANCCEGMPLLVPHGMVSPAFSMNPAYPTDWSAALGVYKQFWDLSKPVLIDKSIGNIDRFPKILKAVQQEGARASFIYVVRSKCYYSHAEMWNTADELRKVVERGKELRKAGASFLAVKYEDMVSNPYAVAKQVLKVIPELQSLDPTKNGLAGAPYTDGDNRGLGLATFVNLKRAFLTQRPKMPISEEEGKWMQKLGYTKKYFTHAPFAQGYFKNGAPLIVPAI